MNLKILGVLLLVFMLIVVSAKSRQVTGRTFITCDNMDSLKKVLYMTVEERIVYFKDNIDCEVAIVSEINTDIDYTIFEVIKADKSERKMISSYMFFF